VRYSTDSFLDFYSSWIWYMCIQLFFSLSFFLSFMSKILTCEDKGINHLAKQRTRESIKETRFVLEDILTPSGPSDCRARDLGHYA
jgi:hypothetical protein